MTKKKETKKVNKTNWTLAIILTFILAFFALILYSPDSPQPTIVTPAVSTDDGSLDEYNFTDIEARESFMEGCNQSGNWETFCNCVFDDLRSTNSLNEVILMALDYAATDELPKKMEDSINRCQ